MGSLRSIDKVAWGFTLLQTCAAAHGSRIIVAVSVAYLTHNLASCVYTGGSCHHSLLSTYPLHMALVILQAMFKSLSKTSKSNQQLCYNDSNVLPYSTSSANLKWLLSSTRKLYTYSMYFLEIQECVYIVGFLKSGHDLC